MKVIIRLLQLAGLILIELGNETNKGKKVLNRSLDVRVRPKTRELTETFRKKMPESQKKESRKGKKPQERRGDQKHFKGRIRRFYQNKGRRKEKQERPRE